MDYITKLVRSKTFWVGLTQIVAGSGLYFTGEQSVNELFLSGSGIVMIIFRMVTKESIGAK